MLNTLHSVSPLFILMIETLFNNPTTEQINLYLQKNNTNTNIYGKIKYRQIKWKNNLLNNC